MISNKLMKMKHNRKPRRGWDKKWARLREQQQNDANKPIAQHSMPLAKESSKHPIEGNIDNSLFLMLHIHFHLMYDVNFNFFSKLYVFNWEIYVLHRNIRFHYSNSIYSFDYVFS